MATPRALLRVSSGLAGAALVASVTLAQVDQDWLGMWRDAQRRRPSALDSEGRIAPPGEPGTPLVVEGQVFEPDGTTPAARVLVFAYHTDHAGFYFDPDEPGAPWRLKGWARTAEDGRFRFRTVRPGPYPDRSEPAHIHVTLESPVRGRQWTRSLLFADDPLVGSDDRARSTAAGRFGNVCEVKMVNGVAHVEVSFRLKSSSLF